MTARGVLDMIFGTKKNEGMTMRISAALPLLLMPVLASAQTQDWVNHMGDDDGVFISVTENSASQSLLQICLVASGNCVYVVDFKIRCEQDAKYPALVNTDEGAKSIEFVCRKIQDSDALVATNFDEIDGLVRAGKRIGFVIPLEGDEFKAVRFSLRGATKALDTMRAAANRAMDRLKQKGGTSTSTSANETEVF